MVCLWLVDRQQAEDNSYRIEITKSEYLSQEGPEEQELVTGHERTKTKSNIICYLHMRFLNTILLATVLAVNYLANALPLYGKTTAELSDALPNLFVPAGITFAIWGIIYLLLIGYTAWSWRKAADGLITSPALAMSHVLNMAWINCWHLQAVDASLMVMIGMLVALGLAIKQTESTFARLTIGVYLGWICIATIANVTVVCVHHGWDGRPLSEAAWTLVITPIGGLITMAVMHRTKNLFLCLSVIWAFVGIVLKRTGDHPEIVVAALTTMVAVAGYAIWQVYANIRGSRAGG